MRARSVRCHVRPTSKDGRCSVGLRRCLRPHMGVRQSREQVLARGLGGEGSQGGAIAHWPSVLPARDSPGQRMVAVRSTLFRESNGDRSCRLRTDSMVDAGVMADLQSCRLAVFSEVNRRPRASWLRSSVALFCGFHALERAFRSCRHNHRRLTRLGEHAAGRLRR